MDCKKAISLIHEYFDGDLEHSEETKLVQHLHQCTDCKDLFSQMEKTEAFLFTMHIREHEGASGLSTSDLLNAVFVNEPITKRKLRDWFGWARRHPAMTAGVIFLLVMAVSVFSFWEPNEQLVIRGDQMDQIIIEGKTVIVPYGKTVYGNLVVENGSIQVDGQIEGNLVVIDGSVQQASTAKISGEVKPINEKLDRILFTIGSWFSD